MEHFDKFCPYCDPYPVSPVHLHEKIDNALFPLKSIVSYLDELFKNRFLAYARLKSSLFVFLLKVLVLTGLMREVDIDQQMEKDILNRSLVVIKEARRRGVVVRALRFFGGKNINFFSIGAGVDKKFFEGIPSPSICSASLFEGGDKSQFKRLLMENNLPFAPGSVFHDFDSALSYVQTSIGFPVVVKPRSGSLSKHTTCGILTKDQLQEAVRISKIIDREFIIEKFIPGKVFRITFVQNELVAACLREEPNVVGDGIHTIEELVHIKNQDPRRGSLYELNTTLHTIPITVGTLAKLKSQGLDPTDVLEVDQKVYLSDKVILASGADIHDVTDNICEKNRLLFEKVARLCGTFLLGIDFIVEDISRPYDQQHSALLEVNTLPYIDMHHAPVSGKPRDVASFILDNVRPE